MARPKAKAPERRYHISGQSVVTIDRKDFYLGIHDSPESIARYAVLIAIYQQNGFRLPDGFDQEEMKNRASLILGEPPQHQESEPITVRHVTACYLEWAKTRAESGSQKELARTCRLCDELDKHAGNLLADKFGPLALQQQRKRWVDAGISRNYVNKQTNLVVRMFKHAVAQELVAPETWQRLKSVEPLRIGTTTAPETEPRKPVALEVVRATAKHLTPILRAMVRIQAATGMRPSEVCNLRPIDIDRSGETWMFRPAKHKTANKGKRKAVPLVGDAREAIEDYLNRHPESYCFSPKESVAWMTAQKRAVRKTKVQPSQVSRRKESPLRAPGDRFDSGSYNQSIKKACIKAKVEPWTPYQLRHLAGTVVRDALGIEHAQALLGHAQTSMTEHYTRQAEQKAIEAAQHAPRL
jgi:integrase